MTDDIRSTADLSSESRQALHDLILSLADSKRIRQSGSGKFKQSIFATQGQDGKTTYALSGCSSRIWDYKNSFGYEWYCNR